MNGVSPKQQRRRGRGWLQLSRLTIRLEAGLGQECNAALTTAIESSEAASERRRKATDRSQ